MRSLLLILSLLILFSCEEEQHPLLTDDDKALALLLDINIANIAKNKYPTVLRDSIKSELRMQICNMHDLQEEELDTVLWMMQEDFDRYNKLYKQLVDTLKRLENEFGSGNNKPLVPYATMIDSLESKKKTK